MRAADVRGVLLGGEVGDDLLLALRRDVPVVEDRHGLRTGGHGLVDLAGRRIVQGRGVLAAVRAPPAPAKLWHIAQLTRKISPPRAIAWLFSGVPGWMTVVHFSSGRPGRGRGRRRRRPGPRSPRVELDLVLGGLHVRPGERHTAGAHLEVDGCRADAGEGGAGLRALGVEAVAGGAVRDEEVVAVLHGVGRGGGRAWRPWERRRSRRHRSRADRAAAAPRSRRGVVVGGQGVHDAVLSSSGGGRSVTARCAGVRAVSDVSAGCRSSRRARSTPRRRSASSRRSRPRRSHWRACSAGS